MTESSRSRGAWRRRATSERRNAYPTDLTDTEWRHLAPYLSLSAGREPAWEATQAHHPGTARRHLLRRAWRVRLAALATRLSAMGYGLLLVSAMAPGDGLWQRIMVALRRATREREGRNPEPSAALMDSQSVRIAEESGGNKGYDAGKNVLGRKRHLLVDTSGLLLAGRVTPANISDNRGARELLAGLAPLMPRLELIWADGAYAGEKLRKWCEEWTGWRLEVVPRDAESPTFEVLPRRWVVERSIGWICRNRRLVKDYERQVQTSECWMKVAMIRLMLKRLGRK